jgi:hypothetical protein
MEVPAVSIESMLDTDRFGAATQLILSTAR